MVCCSGTSQVSSCRQCHMARACICSMSMAQPYFDGCCGKTTANLGHGDPIIADAIRNQAAAVGFAYRGQFTNQPAERLAEIVCDQVHPELQSLFLVSSGSKPSRLRQSSPVNTGRRAPRTPPHLESSRATTAPRSALSRSLVPCRETWAGSAS